MGGVAMNCIKCGRETLGEQVFCQECQMVMAKYPVKPGTAVKLPERRETTSFRRTPKRRAVNLEEQVKVLKKRTLHLTIGLILALLMIAAMIYPSISYLMEDHHKPGQNYTVITTVDSDGADADSSNNAS